MAANDREREMYNGQYWVFKCQFELVMNVLGIN